MDLTQEIEIKANLLVEGLPIEEAVLEGVGTKYRENIYMYIPCETPSREVICYGERGNP